MRSLFICAKELSGPYSARAGLVQEHGPAQLNLAVIPPVALVHAFLFSGLVYKGTPNGKPALWGSCFFDKLSLDSVNKIKM